MERKLAPNSQMNKIYADYQKIYATSGGGMYVINQFNNMITYFAGEFDELTNNIEFKRVRSKFWQTAFYYNEAYLYIGEKGRMQVLTKVSPNLYQIVGTSGYININDESLARFELPLYNVFIQWMNLFDREQTLMKIWELNALSDAKKYKRYINSTDEKQLQEQENNFFNPEKPFIDEYTCLNGEQVDTPNNIEPLPNTPSTTALTFDNIIDHFNFYADRLGYAVSREEKKERLTSGENFINLHNTNNILRMFLSQLEVFAYDVKKLFNVELLFNKQEDLEVNGEPQFNNQESEEQ